MQYGEEEKKEGYDAKPEGGQIVHEEDFLVMPAKEGKYPPDQESPDPGFGP